MKNTINENCMRQLKLITILAIISLSSCQGRKQPVERYCGGIVMHKGKCGLGYFFELKHNGKLTKRVYIHKYDWNGYLVGDTVKCTPQDSILYSNRRK